MSPEVAAEPYLYEEDLFTLDDSFDELVVQAQERPDDEQVFSDLREILAVKREQGDINFVMSRAMQLAAMACTDPHFESISNEAGRMFNDMGHHGDNDGHGHDSTTKDKRENKSSNKKKANYQSLGRTLLTFKLKPLIFFPWQRSAQK